MNHSNFFSLDWKDLGKGLILALIVSLQGTLMPLLGNGTFPTKEQWITIGSTALQVVIGYLIKNLVTNSDGKILKTENNEKQA